MQAQKERDTAPELALRRALHAQGLRFRVHRPIVPGARRTVDVVLPRSRLAVDVRGCFWHGCPAHGTQPKTNSEWWAAKIAQNRARDLDTAERLAADGWELVIVWECEEPKEAANRIAGLVRDKARPQGLT